MKKTASILLVFCLLAALLVGCGQTVTTVSPTTQATAAETTAPTQPAATEETTPEEQLPAAQVDPAYAQPIGDYYAALSQEERSGIGFGYADFNFDEQNELIIGEISEDTFSVLEVWTVVDNKPVQLVKSDEQTRHSLQYVQEDMMWYIVREAGGNATYFLMLSEGELSITQGIIHVTEGDKWYMAYDLDADVSNDDPVDAETAQAILDANSRSYTCVEYTPFSAYRG